MATYLVQFEIEIECDDDLTEQEIVDEALEQTEGFDADYATIIKIE